MNANKTPKFKVSLGFILGLFEGDGSLLISISTKSTNLTGYRVRLSFSITLHVKDISVLHAVQEFLGVGVVEPDNKDKDVYRFIVRSQSDLANVILPFLTTNPMVFAKRSNDCALFLAALNILLGKGHVTEAGLAQIRLLSAGLSGKMSPLEKMSLIQPNSIITPE